MVASSAELFDDIAEDYDEEVPFYATFGGLLVEWTEPRSSCRALDIGAGAGAITKPLARAIGQQGSVVAGDISPKMVDRLAALRLPNVDVRVLDATRLDLPDREFDVVYAGFLLGSLIDPDDAIAEMVRVLRPGGSLVLSMPGMCDGDSDWWVRFSEIIEDFTARLLPPGAPAKPENPEPVDRGSCPDGDGHVHVPATAAAKVLEQAGLRFVEHTTTEINLPIDGPDAYWRWLRTHGVQWLIDLLPEQDRTELSRRILHSLHEHHPFAGKRLVAAATFERLVKVR